ncbi:MAG: NifB/NifX family molybdenum-iron cluster-binding protein [Candidatus Korobacteraceae bacterium]
MGKIALITLLKREDSKLSPHFGKAKWAMITDLDGGVATFVQNTGLNGRAVVDILAANGCTDVVFSGIGAGALRHLQAANIRGWIAGGDVTVPDLLDSFRRGELLRAHAPSEGLEGHGCGEQHNGRRSGREFPMLDLVQPKL